MTGKINRNPNRTYRSRFAYVVSTLERKERKKEEEPANEKFLNYHNTNRKRIVGGKYIRVNTEKRMKYIGEKEVNRKEEKNRVGTREAENVV